MKRILTIICAIIFSGAALSAQNNVDTIKVNRNESDTLVIILKEKQSIDRQAKKEQRLAEKEQKPAYMINVGYNRGYRTDIELSWANKSVWGITSSHGFSFGNGLYVGGGAGFGAELSKNTAAAASVAAEVIDPELFIHSRIRLECFILCSSVRGHQVFVLKDTCRSVCKP